MDKLNIGILGGDGACVTRTARLLRELPGIHIAGWWRPESDQAGEYAGPSGIPARGDPDGLPDNDRIHAVVAADRSPQSQELCIRAAERGKHVYFSGAAFSSNEAAGRLRRAIQRSKAVFSANDAARTPQTRYAKQLMDSGSLGRAVNLRVYCPVGEGDLRPGLERAAATLLWFFGKPSAEKAVYAPLPGAPNASTMTALLQFEEGRLGIAQASAPAPANAWSVDLCGTQGWLRIRGRSVSYTADQPLERNARWVEVGREALPPPEEPGPVRWCRCLQAGRQPPDDDLSALALLTETLLRCRPTNREPLPVAYL